MATTTDSSPGPLADLAAPLGEATDLLASALERAQVEIRPVTATDELAAMESLLAAVWHHPPGSVEIDISLLTALARSGNYVVGAFRPDGAGSEDLVGATVGFHCEPFPATLYSHVTGVDRERANPGTGTALKAYQRVWCLDRGITGVRWTFDALQSRNARLNMGSLGADWAGFHVDYYGTLRDGLNRDTGSDRLLLHWDLTRRGSDRAADREAAAQAGVETLLARGTEGEPVRGGEPTAYARLEIPLDIDGLRATDPQLAQRWRDTLRELLPDLIASGRRVIDFDDGGAYLLTPAGPSEES